MTTDSYIQVPPNSSGSKVDTSELTVNSQTVERQRIVIGDPTTDVALADVLNTAVTGNEYGLAVRALPNDTDLNVVSVLYAVLMEMRDLKQAFLDWSGQSNPRRYPGIIN